MKPDVKERISSQLEFLGKNKNTLIIDADTHISDISHVKGELLVKYRRTPDYYHGRPISAEELLNEMVLAGIDMSLIWQNPATTAYSEDKKQNFENLLLANEYICRKAGEYPEQFIPAGWTDPKALGAENARKLSEICIRDFGFPIVKMNPAQNAFPIDSKEVYRIIETIKENNGIVAFHYGADTKYTPVSGLEKLATSFPGLRIIAVHMGGGGASYLEGEAMYNETRAMGLKYANLFFIQSAKRDTHIESDFITYTLAGAPYTNNIACGSDAPYGRQTWNFGGYRLMFTSLLNTEKHMDPRVRENAELFNHDMVKNYMGRNIAELVIDGYKKIIGE